MDQKQNLDQLKERYLRIVKSYPSDEKRKELRTLESKSLKRDFWQDNQKAQLVMKQIADITSELDFIEQSEKQINDLESLITLSVGDINMKNDVSEELSQLKKKINFMETKSFLSGPHDKNAAILSIHAGQGGTEAMDWVEMLARMYQKYFANKNWKYQVIEEIPGEEAGLKTISIEVTENYAYGLLKAESGVHRLVRQSPFNSANLRQTSFALVELMPEIEETEELEIKPEDILFEAFRSGGRGGQNVNKVSTAVRLKHIQTGIVVTCQTQRHQAQNRENAMKLLKAKLWTKKLQEEKKEKESIKGEHITPGWGNQIRSYVLHPYKMVKDLRTNYETSDAQGVLEGNLEPFIKEELALSAG